MGKKIDIDLPVSMFDRVKKYVSDHDLDMTVDQFFEKAVVEFLDKQKQKSDPMTTIRIRKSTKDVLKGFGMFGDSYDAAIQNLFAYLDQYKSDIRKLHDYIDQIKSVDRD